MAISSWRVLLICFCLFLSLWAFSQKNELTTNSPFQNRIYGISWLQWSTDKQYVSFQKTYEYSSDTMALVSVNKPNQILFQTAPIYPKTIKYTEKGFLFMAGSKSATLLKLPSIEPIIWEDISNAFYSPEYNRIIVLQNNILKVYNEEAELLDEIKDVVSIEEFEKRIFYIQKKATGFSLLEWTPKQVRKICDSSTAMMNVEYCDETVVLVKSKNSIADDVQLIYVDTAVQKVAVLNQYLEYPIKSVVIVERVAEGRYFIRLSTMDLPKEKSSVDIWYGTDNNLEKKFQNNLLLKHVIWEPLKNNVLELDDNRFPKHIAFGNKKYIIAYNPFLHQDYSKQRINYEMYRYDVLSGQYDFLGITGIYSIMDKDGHYLLSYDNKAWVLYNIVTKEKRVILASASAKAYFDDKAESIVFADQDFILKYHIKKDSLTKIKIPKGFQAEFLNAENIILKMENNIYRNYYDRKIPLLVKINNLDTTEQSLGIYKEHRFSMIHIPTDNFIETAILSPDDKDILVVKSNFNSATEIIIDDFKTEKSIFKSNPTDVKSAGLRMDKMYYNNSKTVTLQGLLYYPTSYDPEQKYPMIVGIYELMRNQSNRYLKDGFFGIVEGMNIRYYLDRGYFVYLPDIVYDERGPGWSALDCVESSLDALIAITSIDRCKIGLIGQSHGGYQTNFIATQSKRFVTYVAGAANSDLVRSYHSFNYNFKKPFYWQFEEQQYRMFKAFTEDKELYIDNSPVYHADKVKNPILLWAGTKDENIAWDQSMEFYLALRRNKKNVIALFYKNEGHSFSDKVNREDLFTRISDWLDYYLKGIPKQWIDKM